MKETLKNLGKLFVLLLLVTGCQDDDNQFGAIVTPTNLELGYTIVGQTTEDVNGDGSGNVNITAHADNAITYKFIYPDGSNATSASGEVTKRFTTPGIHSYDVTVIAYGKGGVSTSGMITIVDVLSTFDDPVTVQALTGGSTKVWYVARTEKGHLGVGPNDPADPTHNYWPFWYEAAANEKDVDGSRCFYTNKLTFTKEGNLLKYTLENDGTFFNGAFLPLVGSSGADACMPYDVSGQRNVLLAPSESIVAPEFTTGTQMTIANNGFMGYYIGTSTYEILEITDNRMVVRAVEGDNPSLAWYQIFTTDNPDGPSTPDFNNLVWSDEFDIDGPPNAAKWNIELGNGQGGWGNQELEYYKAQNAAVSGGTLKITAKKEDFTENGVTYHYTSARMNTHNHFDFKYGRAEMSAKMPVGNGTWAAFWMLGSNYLTNAWPACGEIDNMEYLGKDPNTLYWTLHYPGHSGGNADGASGAIAGAQTDFHKYSVTWDADHIKFYYDDQLRRTFNNDSTLPYNANFFIILNLAMGGTFGGPVDASFTQSTMEVDYVRVYQ